MLGKTRDYVKKNSFSQKCKRACHLALGNNRGVAMIYALIVGAVVMAFCLSLLLVTYTLYAQTNRQNTQLQCKLMAQTFAQQLEQDLKTNIDDSELVHYMGTSIKENSWRSLEAEDNMEKATDYTKLFIDCDSEVAGYTYNVVFTYIINTADEDEGDVPGGGDSSEGNPAGGASGDGGAENTRNCTVYSTITCKRGDGKGRNAVSYTLNGEYDISIPLE